MVISTNPELKHEDFRSLLDLTVGTLKEEAADSPRVYCKLNGTKLEKEVERVMNLHAVGTDFENTIELISGQKFPDIVALNKYFGVEIKTTKDNHWKSLGSSVAEGTRVEDVERIYLLFGKMCNPIDFRYRLYEECLSEVLITHSPRYQIDMCLKPGETIFDKMNLPYEKLREREDKIKPILQYYKSKMKPGETTWWAGDPETSTNNFIVKIWNQLSIEERKKYRVRGFCLFPELVSSKADRYNRCAIWLSIKEGVVCPNLRDAYSAGGQRLFYLSGKTTQILPQKIFGLVNEIDNIKKELYQIDKQLLSEYWGEEIKRNSDLFSIWCDQILRFVKDKEINVSLREYLSKNGYMG